MTLGQLGGSLYLIYKERNTRKMRMTSYNVAPYNTFKAVDFNDQDDPLNNTTMHEWSPKDYPVGHFSKKMAALANDYQNLGNMAAATISGELHLVHRGGYEDTPNAFTEIFGMTGIYTAANQLSNGFGTLDQAGWTIEQEMPEVAIHPASPLSMCSDGEKLTLVWVDEASKKINYRQGGYTSTL
jgi:hypothetical protein